jgi:hypothetical protein
MFGCIGAVHPLTRVSLLPGCATVGKVEYAGQEQPDISHAVAFGEQALDLLTYQVDSARCVGHVKTLVEQLAPYKANPAVRQFTDLASRLSVRAPP